MTVVYNEIEPFAADWLEQLIAGGHIAHGRVERRSITELTPADVAGPGQRHFFAGIGVWSYALRLAGIPDDLSVWTGSCPCQPFSAAGKRGGTSDPRHLWPTWFSLIRECRPAIVFGEQVASDDGLHWLDSVFADLEGSDYSVGSADLCAAGVGAPHIRQRLWFVAYDSRAGLDQLRSTWLHGRRTTEGSGEPAARDADRARRDDAARRGANGELGDSCGAGTRRNPGAVSRTQGEGTSERIGVGSVANGAITPGQTRELADDTGSRRSARRRSAYASDGRDAARIEPGRLRDAGELADAVFTGRPEWGSEPGSGQTAGMRSASELADGIGTRLEGLTGNGDGGAGWALEAGSTSAGRDTNRPGSPHDHWRAADWIWCRDGKWRPVEPGTQPLAHGAPARVGRLRGYGNAIVAQVAATFITAALDAISEVKP